MATGHMCCVVIGAVQSNTIQWLERIHIETMKKKKKTLWFPFDAVCFHCWSIESVSYLASLFVFCCCFFIVKAYCQYSHVFFFFFSSIQSISINKTFTFDFFNDVHSLLFMLNDFRVYFTLFNLIHK